MSNENQFKYISKEKWSNLAPYDTYNFETETPR